MPVLTINPVSPRLNSHSHGNLVGPMGSQSFPFPCTFSLQAIDDGRSCYCSPCPRLQATQA